MNRFMESHHCLFLISKVNRANINKNKILTVYELNLTRSTNHHLIEYCSLQDREMLPEINMHYHLLFSAKNHGALVT